MARPQATQSETIRGMFSAISSRYDLANTVLSLGTHHGWRKAAVRWSGARSGHKVLDCASGTGDLAFEFERAVGPLGEITGTDFCEPMLEQARRKAQARASRARFQVADVMALPFADSSFDIASIAFGIRNVADPVTGLSEMARVLRPGGVVMVLEFGQSRLPLWSQAFNFYSRRILPRLGGLLTGNRAAYEYLNTSSSLFPCGGEFVALAEKTGCFDTMEFRTLMGGIAFIYRLRRKGGQA
ncbi:MAG: bifunctional demethylmenaquinone methyltransferase/2-methoxy-6-polyprenyl-1,4-benzoquinol methylase UbiE [Oligoflexia bacterium]|nr:bifunctional demethylmenaquinone methyltransferase/2-methoxy-6-polyprenyl-1,4-benzoquinol methylase UbiE [Oligoflexia bacterium]